MFIIKRNESEIKEEIFWVILSYFVNVPEESFETPFSQLFDIFRPIASSEFTAFFTCFHIIWFQSK